jgi:dipeptidyl aminopeptidase/acylaminoacyl peptidase
MTAMGSCAWAIAMACAACVAWMPCVHGSPLSVESFFKKPAYWGATLSPNGSYLGVIAPIDGQQGLIVLDLTTRAATRMKSPGTGDLLRIVWQNDDRLVVVIGDLQRASGELPKESGLVAVNRDGSDSRIVGGIKAIEMSAASDGGFQRPWTVGLLREIKGTNDILVTARERNIRSLDVYRFDTTTGKKTLLSFDTPGNVGRWVVDFDGVPRAVVTQDLDHDASAWYVRRSGQDPWQKVDEAKLGRLKSEPLEFDPDGKILYVSARRNDADRASIYEYDIATGAWKNAVVSHPVRDLEEGNTHFVTEYRLRKLLGLRYVDDKPAVAWFDAEWAKMQKSVDAALPDTVNLLQRSGDRWVIVSFSDRNPGDAYLLDATTMRLEKLLSFEPWIDPKGMAAQKWVGYPARDGMTIPALLTVPLDLVGKRVPLVVDIHGGPNVQASPWGYNPEVQFLVSRGYSVLQPQLRGTEGFGWKLRSAGYRRWGDEMQDDLEDGVKWAIAQGIADPERVCFYGASYGGYAAAWGAIKNAKLIKCSVAYVGVTSIDYLFDNAQTDLALVADKSTLMVETIGDPKTDRARFRRVNPLDNADKVGVPILLAYGASDLRVPLVHGTDFRAALDKARKDYEWVVYTDEGHGFNKDGNLIDFYGRVERFLAKYLGGAAATSAQPN